jgi:hypothetical protein
MDICYDGRWGYGPLLVSLANSLEILYCGILAGKASKCSPTPYDTPFRVASVIPYHWLAPVRVK